MWQMHSHMNKVLVWGVCLRHFARPPTVVVHGPYVQVNHLHGNSFGKGCCDSEDTIKTRRWNLIWCKGLISTSIDKTYRFPHLTKRHSHLQPCICCSRTHFNVWKTSLDRSLLDIVPRPAMRLQFRQRFNGPWYSASNRTTFSVGQWKLDQWVKMEARRWAKHIRGSMTQALWLNWENIQYPLPFLTPQPFCTASSNRIKHKLFNGFRRPNQEKCLLQNRNLCWSTSKVCSSHHVMYRVICPGTR